MAAEESPISSRNAAHVGFKCGCCSATFASKRTLNYHNRKKHQEEHFICDICGISLDSKIVLMVHKEIHRWEKRENDLKYFEPVYDCSVCDLQTRSPRSLVLHCLEEHPSHEGLFETKKSKKKLNSKFTYDENQNTIPEKSTEARCEVGKQVKCPLCSVFYREDRIKGHFLTGHPFDKHLFCTYCAAIVPDEEEMWSHMLGHSQENNLYKCEFCECLFISVQTLETHLRLHKSQRPFSCSVCQKEFFSKMGAIAHFHSHLKIEMLREKTPQKDTSVVMPLTDTNIAMVQADNGIVMPVGHGCPIITEKTEDFVNVWD